MTEPNTIIHPTIDLFSYDIIEGLGQSDNKINQNRENFWKQIYGKKLTSAQLANFIKTESEFSDYIELLGASPCEDFADPLAGFYYPVKINDTYALQVSCSSDYDDTIPEYAPCDITSFQKIQQNIISQIHSQGKPSTNRIGQTWFVWGQLTSSTQDPAQIAEQIYNQLQIFDVPNWKKHLKSTSAKLIGADCFELWQLPSDRGNISQSKHLLICLFPHDLKIEAISEKISNLYPRLMQLFLYRHKIIWSYSRSRYHKANLKEAVKLIKSAISDDSTKTDLVALQHDLKSTLNLMNSYAEELIYLEDQKNTIETNLKNYQKKLKRLEDPQQDIDLPFLEKFIEIVTDKYIPQIVTDLASLSPAQKSLENSVRNIEGIINIEQAKSDRNLNQTIFAVGTGLGTSQVAAGVIVAQFPAISNDKPNYPPAIYMSGVFLISIAIGAIFGFLVWLLVRSRNSKNP